jgi:hypothetical protein
MVVQEVPLDQGVILVEEEVVIVGIVLVLLPVVETVRVAEKEKEKGVVNAASGLPEKEILLEKQGLPETEKRIEKKKRRIVIVIVAVIKRAMAGKKKEKVDAIARAEVAETKRRRRTNRAVQGIVKVERGVDHEVHALEVRKRKVDLRRENK